ncbi:MAG: hypothetical protein JWN51_111 [Phycisphaerales bacterium]|nr:hypothetical protein [Phycisphaerales bacterium]
MAHAIIIGGSAAYIKERKNRTAKAPRENGEN